jgi:hypothetical protein
LKSAHARIPGLGQFLADFPHMAFRPRAGKPPVLRGRFCFRARQRNAGEIEDEFELEIAIPPGFPKEVPRVIETGGRIPKKADFHVNESDGTLCLGSPLRLLHLLAQEPTVNGFADKCLVPYLFALSRKLAGSGDFTFGELAHGLPGMLNDYVALFGVKDIRQAVEALRLLGIKKRRANKLQCPCGCRQRLGRCPFNAKLREFRAVASRPWFRSEHRAILRVAKLMADRAAQVRNQQKLGLEQSRGLILSPDACIKRRDDNSAIRSGGQLNPPPPAHSAHFLDSAAC